MFLKQVIRITLGACCFAVCAPHSTAYKLSDFASTDNKSVITSESDLYRVASIESARFGVEKSKGSGEYVWASNVKWSTSFDVITSELARCVFDYVMGSPEKTGIQYGPQVLLFNEQNGFKPLKNYSPANYNFLLFVNFLNFVVNGKVTADSSGVDEAAQLFLYNLPNRDGRGLYSKGINGAVSDVKKYVNVVSESLDSFVKYIAEAKIMSSLERKLQTLPYVQGVSIVRKESKSGTSFSGSEFQVFDNTFKVGANGNVSTLNLNYWGKASDATACGLYNIGNICYFNSAIQFLYSFPEFVEFVKSLCGANSKKKSLSSALFSLFNKIKSPENVVVDPGDEFSRIAPYINDGDMMMADDKGNSSKVQHDALELVTRIIDKIDEEIEKTGNAEMRNLFSQNFEAKAKSENCCPRGHTTVLPATFYRTIISLPTVPGGSLNACLAQFFSPQKLNFPCVKCKKGITGTCTNMIETSPKILMINFGRSSYEKSVKKLSDRVDCPSVLTYNGHLYRLVSLISHISGSTVAGHYIAKRLLTTHRTYGDYTNSKKSAWIMNDASTHVGPMDAGVAYVVGYRRID